MALWPTTARGLRALIASYRRGLRDEYERFGMWGDGYGKRLWLFHLYFLLRDDDQARTYLDWYVATFPNDSHEVCQCVCWALILRRLGREEEAVYRLVRGIAMNLPAVAKVVGDDQGPYGIWGEEVMGFYWIAPQIIKAMSDEERQWLVNTWRLPAVTKMRERYIALERSLVTLGVGPERSDAVDEQGILIQAFCPTQMTSLSTNGASWLTARKQAKRAPRGGTVIRTSPDIWRPR